MRDDQPEHFKLLHQALLSLGADPTARTPCADASGVMPLGILQVLTDPRKTTGPEVLLTVADSRTTRRGSCW